DELHQKAYLQVRDSLQKGWYDYSRLLEAYVSVIIRRVRYGLLREIYAYRKRFAPLDDCRAQIAKILEDITGVNPEDTARISELYGFFYIAIGLLKEKEQWLLIARANKARYEDLAAKLGICPRQVMRRVEAASKSLDINMKKVTKSRSLEELISNTLGTVSL